MSRIKQKKWKTKKKKNANDKIFKNLYINNFGGDELN